MKPFLAMRGSSDTCNIVWNKHRAEQKRPCRCPKPDSMRLGERSRVVGGEEDGRRANPETVHREGGVA